MHIREVDDGVATTDLLEELAGRADERAAACFQPRRQYSMAKSGRSLRALNIILTSRCTDTIYVRAMSGFAAMSVPAVANVPYKTSILLSLELDEPDSAFQDFQHPLISSLVRHCS